MSCATVAVQSLRRTFGDFVAVDNISFEISAGDIWGFLGPNGSGKSTTIRMLCGVLAPSAGTAIVLGNDVARDPESVKLAIGYMSQGANLWHDLTVVEHLQLYGGLFGLTSSDLNDAMHRWITRLDLENRSRQLAGTLPVGYQKRLALACTLLHRPKMIFLDEPTAGVDPVSRRDFWDIILSLADEGTTVMVTTHYLDEAEHCSQLAMILNGKIVASGTPDTIKQSPGIGTTAEIISKDNVAILDVTDTLSYVRGAGLFGASLHVNVEQPSDLPRLRADLARHGFAVEDLTPITPSLEDVFAEVMAR